MTILFIQKNQHGEFHLSNQHPEPNRNRRGEISLREFIEGLLKLRQEMIVLAPWMFDVQMNNVYINKWI